MWCARAVLRTNERTMMASVALVGRRGLGQLASRWCSSSSVAISSSSLTRKEREAAWAKFKKSRDQQQAADALAPLQPLKTEVEHTVAINVCGQVYAWEQAVELHNTMSSRELAPNVFTYSAAITACARSGQSDAAFALFENMRAAGVAPNIVTYTAMLSACATPRTDNRSLTGDGSPKQSGVAAGLEYSRVGGLWDSMMADGISPQLRT